MTMRIAAVQMTSGADPAQNLEAAVRLVRTAAEAGARYIQLPEYMNYLGPAERNLEVAEEIPGTTTQALGAVAREHNVYVHAGSILARGEVDGLSANVSVLIGPDGEIIGSYRKIHLFDIDVPDEVEEQESASIIPGTELVTAPVDDVTFGLSVCFDVRFPELYRALAVGGAHVLAVPAAFAVATGRAHWSILLRARAIENHAYVVAAGQAGETPEGIASYGHSMIIDPWGKVLAEATTDGEEILYAEVDREEVERRRAQIAVLSLRRPELYEVTHA
ncbi:MAG TPA: carbon-nitrogen hydrolase family protein [Acidimicrobiales bacterium]